MFWENFYNLCIEKTGKKPNALRMHFDVSSGIITKWKNGGIPSGETLIKIADYLNCSVDYLLGREIKSEAVSASANSPEEEQLLTYFRRLNNLGKSKAIESISDLSEINKYINGVYIVKKAARDGTFEEVTVTDDDIKHYEKLEQPSDEI